MFTLVVCVITHYLTLVLAAVLSAGRELNLLASFLMEAIVFLVILTTVYSATSSAFAYLTIAR
jgi:hypothetical protein